MATVDAMINPPPGDQDPRQSNPVSSLFDRLKLAKASGVNDPETLAALREQTSVTLPRELVPTLVSVLGPRFAADLALGPQSRMPEMLPVKPRFSRELNQRPRLSRFSRAVGSAFARVPKGLRPNASRENSFDATTLTDAIRTAQSQAALTGDARTGAALGSLRCQVHRQQRSGSRRNGL